MGKLKIGRMVLGNFQTNCYFVYREGEQNAEGLCPVILIDPAERGRYIYDTLKKNGLSVSAILLTHGHVDHISGADELKRLSGAPIYAAENEANVLQDMHLNLSQMFGAPCKLSADILLKDGEVCTVHSMHFQVITTPGHTEGSCSFYFDEDDCLISGDTLFENSVGRTDFPTGSMSVLVRSIKQKLFKLPEATTVYPGHGSATTIGWEKTNNPFIV